MPLNNSGKWFMLTKSGEVVEGETHPEAASVLAAPGANIPNDVVEKYDLAEKIKGEEPHPVDSVGRPIVHADDGRAMSIDAYPKDHPLRAKAEKAEADRQKTLAEKPKPAPKAEAAK
jgi:hypothetical protein